MNITDLLSTDNIMLAEIKVLQREVKHSVDIGEERGRTVDAEKTKMILEKEGIMRYE